MKSTVMEDIVHTDIEMCFVDMNGVFKMLETKFSKMQTFKISVVLIKLSEVRNHNTLLIL